METERICGAQIFWIDRKDTVEFTGKALQSEVFREDSTVVLC